MGRYSLGCFAFVFSCLSFSEASVAEENWPEVLTLDYALQRAAPNHPDIQVAGAVLEKARAGLLQAESQTGITSTLSGRLRWIEPADVAPDQDHDDHRLSLFVNKRLYDFGRSAALESASESLVLSQEQRYEDALNRHRIAIMAAYFDVVLADLTNARDEEAMAVAFISADRARDRNELGQMSDIDVLEAESQYQVIRLQRYRSSHLQRTTRSNLANVLDRPGNLPSELAMPDLDDILQRKIPDGIDEWLQEVEQNNPLLVSSRAQLEQAQQELAAARAFDNPVINAELEASSYTRDMGGYDKLRATLSVDVPLITGGRAKAERAKSLAKVNETRAMLEQARRQVQQSLLELWSELRALKVDHDRAKALVDYRNLYLDRSRGLYEMEVKTDLGDAMSKTSDARLQLARVEFNTALTWARIEALMGRSVYETAGPADAVSDVAGSKVDASNNEQADKEKNP